MIAMDSFYAALDNKFQWAPSTPKRSKSFWKPSVSVPEDQIEDTQGTAPCTNFCHIESVPMTEASFT
jgi:hypothetical protein